MRNRRVKSNTSKAIVSTLSQIRELSAHNKTNLVQFLDQNRVFPHKYIPHVDMEETQCFEPVLQALHTIVLLNLCNDVCSWNEEIIIQFYATLHISGDGEDSSSWVMIG